MEWNALKIELFKSPASILLFILEENVICLPLELILVGAVDGPGGAVKVLVSGAAMSLVTCGAACACGRCGGYELVVTCVSLCAASGISVLGDEPLEGTGLTAFPNLPLNIGVWFAKSTACVTPILELFLDRARAVLLTFSLLSMVSA